VSVVKDVLRVAIALAAGVVGGGVLCLMVYLFVYSKRPPYAQDGDAAVWAFWVGSISIASAVSWRFFRGRFGYTGASTSLRIAAALF
jgi:hypothetical protein